MDGICFGCGEKLDEISDNDPHQHNATIFYARGNYGSGVFDPMNSRLRLKINICDGCLVKNKDRTILLKTSQPLPEYTYREWNPIDET